MRVLLTDGSGLTSRQTAGLLAAAGHHVGVLSPDPRCLARHTRAVRRVHRVPPYGADPWAWLDAAVAAHTTHGYDVLLPTQDQVAVLAREADGLAAAGVATAVPSFAAVAAVQDKVAATATLADLDLPQPATAVMADAVALAGWDRFPAFVKAAVGTASGGVWPVAGAAALAALVAATPDLFAAGPVVVQARAAGPLAMVQAVADGGTVVAFHAVERTGEGVRGGASHKRSRVLPAARAVVGALARALDWTGALSADVVMTTGGPEVIDVNPRLVEPVNAARAGVDLVGPLLGVATGGHPGAQPDGRPGVATHQLLVAVLGAAQRHGTRRAVAAELVAAAARRGAYRGSTEELTPLAGDPRALVPLVVAAAATLARPASWRGLTSGSVAGYALSAPGWAAVRAGR